jgi:hypothetical protein
MGDPIQSEANLLSEGRVPHSARNTDRQNTRGTVHFVQTCTLMTWLRLYDTGRHQNVRIWATLKNSGACRIRFNLNR